MDGKTKPALPEGFEPNFEDGELTTHDLAETLLRLLGER